MDPARKRASMHALLNPRSIAVIGANEKEGYGGRFMRNIMMGGNEVAVHPVNPSAGTVYGLRAFPSVKDIGSPVDLAVVIVKADIAENVIRDCAEAGAGAVLVITAGFRELNGEAGLAAERRMAALARETGMRIVGPNCIGLANVKDGIWACSLSSFSDGLIQTGPAALVSQSGATGFGPLLTAARDRNVGFKYIVTTGNEADLGLCDFVDHVLDDPEIATVAALIEGVRDFGQLVAAARKAKGLGKNLVVLKIGESEVGSRAAASHTASLTGDMALFNAMAVQFDVLKVDDYDELVEMVQICGQTRPLTGKRLAVVSQSGGIGGLAGDKLGKHGFTVPVFSEKTQGEIGTFLRGFGSAKNPLDLTGHMRRPALKDILASVERNEEIDGYVLATHGGQAAMETILSACDPLAKPAYLVWTGSLYSPGLDEVRAARMPLCFSLEKFAKNLRTFAFRKRYAPVEERPCPQYARSFAGKPGAYLDEDEAKAFVDFCGLRTPERSVCASREEAERLAAALPDGRYALKVVSDAIIHKTDVGGVTLGVAREDIPAAYDAILRSVAGHGHQAERMMVEAMCPEGLDLMVGIREDALYGPVLVLGLGGVYTELFKAVACRLLPVSQEIVDDMLGDVPGLDALFAGFRNRPGYDREGLVKAVCVLCDAFMANRASIDLLEVNPLRVVADGPRILDCVIRRGEHREERP